MRDEILSLIGSATPHPPFSPPYPAGETWLTRILRQAPGWRWTFGKHYDQTWRERHGAPNKLLIRATRSSPPRSNTPRLGFRSRFSSFHYSLAYLACTLPSPPSPPISIRNWCRFTRRKSIVSSRKIFIFAVSLKLANRSEILIPFPLRSVCFEHRLVSRSYFC